MGAAVGWRYYQVDQIRSLNKLHNFCRISKEYTEKFAWVDNIYIDNQSPSSWVG